MDRSTRLQWGFLFLALGAALLIFALMFGRIPTWDGTTVWNPWWWGGFLAGWTSVVMGVLLLLPPGGRRR